MQYRLYKVSLNMQYRLNMVSLDMQYRLDKLSFNCSETFLSVVRADLDGRTRFSFPEMISWSDLTQPKKIYALQYAIPLLYFLLNRMFG